MPVEDSPEGVRERENILEGHSFDNLARVMAEDTSISRGRVLKLVGAVLLGAVGLASLPGIAEGKKKKGKGKKKKKPAPMPATAPMPACVQPNGAPLVPCPHNPIGAENGCCPPLLSLCCPFACCPLIPGVVACGIFEVTPCITFDTGPGQ